MRYLGRETVVSRFDRGTLHLKRWKVGMDRNWVDKLETFALVVSDGRSKGDHQAALKFLASALSVSAN